MKFKLPLIVLLATGATATAVIASDLAPAGAQGQPFWANVHWDDDDDELRRLGPMPLPSEQALKAAGVVRVVEVERDDGQLEIEGYDADGRELDIKMDATGQQVLSVKHDD